MNKLILSQFHKKFYINSKISRPNLSVESIEEEPMFFSSSLNFAIKNGGPITKFYLENLNSCLDSIKDSACNLDLNYKFMIDTRSHMLMPGFYPSIPGWHCDFVPRNDYNSQPDFNSCDLDFVKHIIVCIGADGADPESYTEFLKAPAEISIDNNEKIWEQVHNQIQYQIKNGKNEVDILKNEEFLIFDQHGIHRATPAKNRGWRWFMRVSYGPYNPIDKIRKQTQVYIEKESAGW